MHNSRPAALGRPAHDLHYRSRCSGARKAKATSVVTPTEDWASAHISEPDASAGKAEALDFRAWWLDRVRDVGYDQGLANTDLGYIATMVHTLEAAWLLKLSLPFKGFRIAGEKHNPRVPYDPDFVRTRIPPGTEFASMNSEACAVVVIVAATGMRPSEIVGLTAPRIKLDAAIPRVEIRPDLRQLKTVHSQRNIPLVGRALK